MNKLKETTKSQKNKMMVWCKVLPDGLKSNIISFPILDGIFRQIKRKQVKTPSADYPIFLRNFPLFGILGHVVIEEQFAGGLKLAVLGCSNGAELYSAVYTILSCTRSLNIHTSGVDISERLFAAAESGIYATGSKSMVGQSERWKIEKVQGG